MANYSHPDLYCGTDGSTAYEVIDRINTHTDENVDIDARLNAKYDKADHIDERTDVGDAGKPIKLNGDGYIDNTLMIFNSLNLRGTYNPYTDPYPAPEDLEVGDYWVCAIDPDAPNVFNGTFVEGDFTRTDNADGSITLTAQSDGASWGYIVLSNSGVDGGLSEDFVQGDPIMFTVWAKTASHNFEIYSDCADGLGHHSIESDGYWRKGVGSGIHCGNTSGRLYFGGNALSTGDTLHIALDNLEIQKSAVCYDYGSENEGVICNNDFLLYGRNGYSVVRSKIDPSTVYLLDGSNSLRGHMNANGWALKNIADPVDDGDAVNKRSLLSETGNYVKKSGDDVTGTLNFTTADPSRGNIVGKTKQFRVYFEESNVRLGIINCWSNSTTDRGLSIGSMENDITGNRLTIDYGANDINGLKYNDNIVFHEGNVSNIGGADSSWIVINNTGTVINSGGVDIGMGCRRISTGEYEVYFDNIGTTAYGILTDSEDPKTNWRPFQIPQNKTTSGFDIRFADFEETLVDPEWACIEVKHGLSAADVRRLRDENQN